MTRKRSLSLISLVAGGLLLASCGDPTASPSNSSSSPTTSAPPQQTAVVFYYVADTPLGFKLFPETHQVLKSDDQALAAVQALVANQAKPLDPDYTNLWSAKANRVLSLTRSGANATVDLDYQGLNVGSAGEISAIDQIVWTVLKADPTLTAVKLTVNGEPVESLAGHVDTTGWFRLEDGFEVLNSVEVDTPAYGSTLSSPVTITGVACTFEANVAWDLRRDNKVVASGSTLAAGACPVRGAWSLYLGQLDPGIYVFRAYELSAKDGSLSSQDTKSFIVE